MRTLILAICIIGLLTFQSCSKGPEQPPNVIIILTDDQGWGDLSIHGNTNILTPNIDRIATEGASFNNFYVCAVCSPTRAELLTGRYHFRGGVYSTGGGGERLDMDELTIAEVFKQAGYTTAAYGKWHNGMQYPYHPNARGFDDFYGFCSGHWGNYFSPMLEHNGKIVQGNGFIIDDFTDHGLQFMEQNRDKPFFLYLPFNTPHTPFQAPEKNWAAFKDKEIDMKAAHEGEIIEETRAALSMCENIDENVGRILAKVADLGLEENTIVLFFHDNGPNTWRWNGGMRGRKGSTDEGGVRSPLLVKWPNKINAGTQIEEVTSVVDLLPSLSELCGIDYTPQKPLDGVSLEPLLVGGKADWEDRYILNNWGERFSIRSQRFRLDHEGRLYDIENDRAQTIDVSTTFPDIQKEMLAVAAQYRVQRKAELPTTETRPFLLGHPGLKYTQMPARDAVAHGTIKRSNRWPNCSFFQNWSALDDSITWTVTVPEAGIFKVDLYYTCAEENTGSMIRLSVGSQKLDFRITEAHDPPLKGMEEDLCPRKESYVKDWKVVEIGVIELLKGDATMTLRALEIPGNEVIDFRLLQFERIE